MVLTAYRRRSCAQATLVEGSRTGSGAGPQMYAEKIGFCSVRSPREMMIPIGLVATVVLTYTTMGWLSQRKRAN